MPEVAEPPVAVTPVGDAFADVLAAIETSEAEAKVKKPPELPKPAEPEKQVDAKESPVHSEPELKKTPETKSDVPESLFAKLEPEIELPEAPPKTAKDWKKFTDAYKLTREEVVKLKKNGAPEVTEKLSKYETDLKTLQTQRETIEKERNDLLGVIEQIGLERSPRFQEKYIKPREEKFNAAIERVKNAGIDIDEFQEAVSLPPKRRDAVLSELLAEMSDAGRAKVYALLDHVDEIDSERKAALARQPEEWKKIAEAELAEQTSAQESAANQRRDSFSKISRTLPETFYLMKKADGADEWNERADKIVAQANHLLFEEPNFEKLAEAAILAPQAPIYQEMWLKEREARMKLETQVKELAQAEPGLHRTGGTVQSDKPKSLADEWEELQRR